MQLSEVNNTFQHRITGGGDYGWNCYGFNNWSIDYSSDYVHGYVVFNIITGEVYEVSVTPNVDAYEGNEPKPYRYIDPAYRAAYDKEAAMRGIDPNEAWDDVKWVDLETETDFIEKASKMFKGESFDTRIVVPLDLDNDTMLQLAMEAHKRDITLNEMVELVLREVIDKHDFNKMNETAEQALQKAIDKHEINIT